MNLSEIVIENSNFFIKENSIKMPCVQCQPFPELWAGDVLNNNLKEPRDSHNRTRQIAKYMTWLHT